jgi:hypothetical protein
MDATVRRSQAVTTYGVGAMIATQSDSVMVAGLDFWPVTFPDLHEPRLERRLNVTGFVQPPAGDGAPALPVVRFPLMHSCPECRRLGRFWELADGDTMQCRTCASNLVPSRFVVACASGHIDDFPYMQWVHGSEPWDTSTCRLSMTTSGVSASLRDIVISCTCGVPPRSMDGAFRASELNKVAACRGTRPWLKDRESCGGSLRTMQRGASNVWFGQLVSALSIPPWSDAAFEAINRFWTVLRGLHDPSQIRGLLEGMGGEAVLGTSVDEVVHAIMARKQEEEHGASGTETDFRHQEYDAIRTGRKETGADDQFVARSGEVPDALAGTVAEVVLVDRLREVRVLDAFTRLLPPSSDDTDDRLAPLSLSTPNWLPGMEVRGEGLFIGLAAEALERWEQDGAVVRRAQTLRARHAARDLAGDEARSWVTPRFLLVHTLAHALIDALSLDAGYPAASLRERLYVSDEMAGFLVYTATSDSAGSLGGIIAQGEPSSLTRVFVDAVRRHAWCSADPVCIESEAQGVGGLNGAACHACSLLPETSCEHRNVLLDRALLVGTPREPGLGYFRGLVD